MKEETKYGKNNQPIESYQRKLVEYLKVNNPERKHAINYTRLCWLQFFYFRNVYSVI